MAFSSFEFLLRFLPISLILYYLCPKRAQNALLVVLSLVFYAWGSVYSLPWLLLLCVVGYVCALIIGKTEKKKPVLIIGVTLLLGSLFAFKYTDFVIENLNALGLSLPQPRLTAPAGISFFVFTLVSYVADVYMGKAEAEKNPINLLLHICFFPKLLMGPIMRYGDMKPQLTERNITAEGLEQGAVRFITGLAKKVVIADNIAQLYSEVCTLGFTESGAALCWLGIIAYAMQLYYDFSGYSDMAVGLGLMLGFTLPENFTQPYSSHSATEFWRRWHMSVGGWFRDYIYIPLGGSRCSKLRNLLNMLAVWAFTGLWHGAAWNFVLWGLYYFLLLVLEKLVLLPALNKYQLPARIYTAFITLIGWAIFATGSLPQLVSLLGGMFSFSGGIGAIYYIKNYGVLLIISLLLCTETAAKLYKKICEKSVARALIAAALLILSLCYITDSTYSPFLYAQF